MLTAKVSPGSSGPEEAQFRAVGLLSQQVRAQAYTLAIADAFLLIGWVVAAYLLLMVFLRPGKISFKDLRNMK
jgi:DHA2 family multidrug resistance protein